MWVLVSSQRAEMRNYFTEAQRLGSKPEREPQEDKVKGANKNEHTAVRENARKARKHLNPSDYREGK